MSGIRADGTMPLPRPALRRAAPWDDVKDLTEFWRSPVWWGALAAAMCTDILSYLIPTPLAGPGAFLLIWMAVFAANWRTLPRLPAQAFLPLLYPLLELASVLWSLAPMQSLKISLATIFTLLAAYLATRRIAPRDLILILLLVTFTGGIISLGLGTRREALIGIYGSKNNLSLYASLLAISGLAVAIERRNHALVRLIGFAAVLLAPMLLIQGNSVGAMTSISVACAVVLAAYSFTLVPYEMRLFYALCMGVAAALLVGFAYAAVNGDTDVLLSGVGKNSTLTGRVYLWARAAELIRERPWLGHGIAGFWVQGNIDAEGLWRYSMVDSRMGFHFHNLWYQVGVDLGYVGIATLLLWMAATGGAIGYWVIARPSAESAFYAGLMTFYCMRTFTEVEIAPPYVFQGMMFMSAYVYATQYGRLSPRWPRAEAARRRAGGAGGAPPARLTTAAPGPHA